MKLSIIIPAKNEEQNIVRCLHALARQKSDSVEIIVVDNGSTDNTVALAKTIADKVFVKPEFSLSELRNFGAGQAGGDVFAFLDADCVVDGDWSVQIQKTLENREVGCTGSTPEAPDDGTWVERVWSSFRTRRRRPCFASWINSSNFIVRRELFERVGGFNAGLTTCEDVDIGLRLARVCKILFDPSIRVVHYGEPKTVTQFFLKEIWRGKGSFSGIFSHGLDASELKSLMLPLYYLLISVGIVACIFLHNLNLVLLLALLYLVPAIAFALWVIKATGKAGYLFGYLFLFLVYANARTVALFCR
jgi:glycosyltransferase involved in cell wall biosynthesis